MPMSVFNLGIFVFYILLTWVAVHL